jgi:tetratricopeptide (TPR) repeat protein
MTNHFSPTIDATGLGTLSQLQRWADVVTHGTPLLTQADSADVFVQVIHAHWALDQHKDALALIQKGRTLWPAETRFHYYAGMVCLDMGLPMQAEREARNGLTIAPAWAPLHGLLGRAALVQMDYATAKTHLTQALALEPGVSLYHYMHAVATWNLGNAPQGQASLTQALALDPTNSDYLAMQADFSSGADRKQAVKLMRQSLRINPVDQTRQTSLRSLTTLWAVDVALAVGGVGLTVLAQLLSWESWQGWLVVLVNLVVGLRLLAPARRPVFIAFCVANAACWAWSSPVGLPGLWRSQGMLALLSLETVAYLAGTGVFAFAIALIIKLVKWFAWDSLLAAYAFVQEARQSWRDGVLRAYVLDVLQRRGVQFNLAAATATALCVAPPINLAMSMLLLVFVLPIVVWLLGVLLLPAAARPTPSVVFMLLGFTLMLATFLFTSYTKFNLAQPDYGLQALWALGVGCYALLLVNQLRRL